MLSHSYYSTTAVTVIAFTCQLTLWYPSNNNPKITAAEMQQPVIVQPLTLWFRSSIQSSFCSLIIFASSKFHTWTWASGQWPLHSLSTHGVCIHRFKGQTRLESRHSWALKYYKHLFQNLFNIMSALSISVLLICLLIWSVHCLFSICAPFCLLFPHTSNTHSGRIQSQ